MAGGHRQTTRATACHTPGGETNGLRRQLLHGGRLDDTNYEHNPADGGKKSLVHHDGSALYAGLPNPFPAGRYHSLRAERELLPDSLQLTAWTEEGVVMGVAHKTLPRFGVQFHPESILTPQGKGILARFLALSGEAVAVR